MASNTFYHFDGDPEDEAAWQAFVATNRESAVAEAPITSSTTALKRLYELFLLFVVVVALVGTVLWQQDAAQVAALEAKVRTLEEDLINTAVLREDAVALSDARPTPVYDVIQSEYLRILIEAGSMTTGIDDIAARLDSAYGDLRADLGFQADLLDEKVNILLVDESADTNAADNANLYGALGVIVIDVARRTEQIADDQQLVSQEVYSNLYGRLAHRLLDRLPRAQPIRPVWGVVVTHLYANLEASQRLPSAAILPAYKVQQRELAQLFAPSAALLQRESHEWLYPVDTIADAVADSLAEYILVAYGRASLPHLLDAMGNCADWNDLSDAVFGISVDQFTAEWHAYLQAHYPIVPEPSEF